MKITRPIEYDERYLPPRCRIPRYRRVQAKVTAEIPEATDAEAPVAIVQHGNCRWNRVACRNTITYRWFDGRLWARPHHSYFVAVSSADKRMARPSDIYVDRWFGNQTAETAQQRFAERMSEYLLVDGKLHVKIGEPRYYVSTLGLGCNHSGTYLSTDNGYNPNIPWHRYVRCDRLKEALALHKKIALARGDTKSVPSRYHARFDILLPDALQVDPKAWGGQGDDFLNKCENVIEGVKDPTTAAFGLMAMAFR